MASVKGGQLHFYFSGDLLAAGNKVASTTMTSLRPSILQQQISAAAKQMRVPLFMVARPGTFGSSGDHRQRRRAPEAALLNAAVDQLKVKYALSSVSLVGVSTGGHAAAALISMRTDLQCVVLVSSVSMPRMRWMQLGLTQDPTGFNDVVEPAELLQRSTLSLDLHVVIIGDPGDKNTPFPTQLAFGDKLKERGVRVKVVELEAKDPMRHQLVVPGQQLAARCMREVRDGIWTVDPVKLR
jgi:pimeloyl-ACP methyl ester carboxylesterase